MEFDEVLQRRRMVRRFRPDPVERDVIERIVHTIRRAPSAGFSQGVRLLVLTEGGTRKRIGDRRRRRVG